MTGSLKTWREVDETLLGCIDGRDGLWWLSVLATVEKGA